MPKLTSRPLRPALLLLLAASLLASPGGAAAQEGAVVYVVRHAERAPGDDGPPLAEAGLARARLLARMLADAELTGVFSTDYARTRETAHPVASGHGLSVEIYDPDEADRLVARLRRSGGRHLVVGHSNTVPELVRLLGGEPGLPIADGEYDRLYVVVLGERSASALLRYGEPFRPVEGRGAGR